MVRDRRYGAAMLQVSWQAGAAQRTVRVEQIVATRDRGLLPAQLSAHERLFWTVALPSMPTDGIVKATAQRIVGTETQPRAKARAIYDWVVDNCFRDAAVRGCGIGGVEGMLKTGYLGGKCADINSLAVALFRASDLPARDVYGVRLGPSTVPAVAGRQEHRCHPRPALPRRGLARPRGLAAGRSGRRAQGGAGGAAAGG